MQFELKGGHDMAEVIDKDDEVVFVGRYFMEGAFALNAILGHDLRGQRENVDKVIVYNSRTGVVRVAEVIGQVGFERQSVRRIAPFHYVKPGLEGLLKGLSARTPSIVVSAEVSGEPMVCLKWCAERRDPGSQALFVLTAPDETLWMGEPDKFSVSWVGKANEYPYLEAGRHVAQSTINPDQTNYAIAIWPEAHVEVLLRPCLIATSKGIVEPKYYFNIEKLRW
jgi:hypothetical protein